MSKKWDILLPGTRIRLKGDKVVEGTIIEFLKDNNDVLIGYNVKPDDASIDFMFISTDDDFEII